MQSGLRRPTYDRRDYDFHKSFGSQPVSFPPEYSVDADIWNPDQNEAMSASGIPTIPPLPYGCTDYSQTDLCMDEDGVQLNPMDLEAITHANANGGTDIRASLKAAIQAFKRTAYFQITARQPLDMFDAIRLAMYSTASEKRAVSAGTPFYPEWLDQNVLSIPDLTSKEFSWHNWKVAGWKMIGDQPYLICKMWTGDWKYMSRSLCNQLFAISGCVAYTLSKTQPGQIQPIDFNFVQWLVSWFQSVFTPQASRITPPAAPISVAQPQPEPVVVPAAPAQPASAYDWSTPEAARHSVRVICDEAGYSLIPNFYVAGKAYTLKDVLCACIQVESQFYNYLPDGTPTKHENRDSAGTLLSTDWGICQINDHYHIGPKLDFPSVDYVMQNPDKAVRFMASMFNTGNARLWVSYSSGAFKAHLPSA